MGSSNILIDQNESSVRDKFHKRHLFSQAAYEHFFIIIIISRCLLFCLYWYTSAGKAALIRRCSSFQYSSSVVAANPCDNASTSYHPRSWKQAIPTQPTAPLTSSIGQISASTQISRSVGRDYDSAHLLLQSQTETAIPRRRLGFQLFRGRC